MIDKEFQDRLDKWCEENKIDPKQKYILEDIIEDVRHDAYREGYSDGNLTEDY